MEFKNGNLINTKAADAGLDTNAIKALMIARGIDPKEITPEEVAERFVRLVASTEDVDAIGDVVKSGGWDFTTWLDNPAMFADHRQTLDHTIARGLQAYVDTATKTAVIDAFFVPERYDKFGIAEFCHQLYKAGLAKGVSVGAFPVEAHYATKADMDQYGDKVRRVWDKSQLLELSFVGIPMNASAQVSVVAKALAEKKIGSEMFDRMATCDSAPWSMFAKAAMYERKSFEAPTPEPTPVPPPAIAPEIKSMIDTMAKSLSEQAAQVQALTASAADQKKANAAILKRLEMKDDGDVLHISSADLQEAMSYLAAAAEILGARLPKLDDDPDDDPSHTQDDAVDIGKVDDCNGTGTTKAAGVALNGKGVAHAKALVKDGKVNDGKWDFTTEDENALLGKDGSDWANYAQWFLGIHTEATEKTKGRFAYPFGKGGEVYRKAIIAAKSRAVQQGHDAVEKAADAILQMIDKPKSEGGKGFDVAEMQRLIDLAQTSQRTNTQKEA